MVNTEKKKNEKNQSANGSKFDILKRYTIMLRDMRCLYSSALFTLALNLIFGGWSVRALMFLVYGYDLSWLIAIPIGLVFGEFTIPMACIIVLLWICGLPCPLIR